MKRQRLNLVVAICFFLCTSSLFADTEQNDTSRWLFNGSYTSVAKAKFDEDALDGQKLQFSQGGFQAKYIWPWAEKTSIITGLGTTQTHLSWDQNPSFSEENFGYVDFFLGASTDKVEDWNWQGGIFAHVDQDDFDLEHNSLYRFGLHGRRVYSDDIGIHVGFLATTGLSKDLVLPVLGVDIALSPKWQLDLVFPKKASLSYKFNDTWKASLDGRAFRSRHRVSADQTLSEGIFDYKGSGVQVAMQYTLNRHFVMKGFLGSSISGDLKIMDRSGDNPIFRKLKSAGFGGIEAVLRL